MPKTNRFAFASISLLFFLFGFITCLNDILVPHLKSLFELNYRQSMFIQFSFFSAYFFFSLPSGYIVRKFGYRIGIVCGLAIAGVGAMGFLPAGHYHSYGIFLAALFVLACGVTLLQLAANPYATALGPPETAPARLNLAQAFNSLGTSIAPILGSYVILSFAGELSGSSTSLPYFAIGSVLFFLAVVFKNLALPVITDEGMESKLDANQKTGTKIFEHTRLIFGILGIFCYVGAEVGIGSILVNYIVSCWAIEAAQAGHYVAIYWTLTMVGRFLGFYFLKTFRPANCLTFVSCSAACLVALSMLVGNEWSPILLLAVGLFNSIMFPVTFSLSIEGLGRHTSRASSYLCMAIVGGAILPVLQGWMSDHVGLRLAFAIPFAAYLYLVWFALRMRRMKVPCGERKKHEFITA
jgi:FHS family L-fucose permease-like MFS transporter